MEKEITTLYQSKPQSYTRDDRTLFDRFLQALESGQIRACEPNGSGWKVNSWVKMGILAGFRMGAVIEMPWSEHKSFFDKDTFPERTFTLHQGLRIVPGGTSARGGCHLEPGVTVMPPSFINVGAWVDSGTLVDSHALVGSCAQVGKNVHLSAGAMLGGVLEPIGSRPVVIEDDVFVGGNSGIYEGVIVQQGAVIASGTIITGSTPIFDATRGEFLQRDLGGSFTVPAKAVVVPGSRSLSRHQGFQVYCPIIIKYRDAKTDVSVQLERDLRAITQ